jgi:hypothetical protein
MTEDAKQAWSLVGERFSSWGRRVARHYGEAGGASDATGDETQGELRRVAGDLIDELSKSFTAVTDTLRDDEAKRELTDAMSAIGDAITATVNEASEGIRSGKRATGGSSNANTDADADAGDPPREA